MLLEIAGRLLAIPFERDAREPHLGLLPRLLPRQALGHLPGLAFMPEAPYGQMNAWLTCLTVDPEAFGRSREDLRLALEKLDIEARPVWKPMHLQPVFSGCRVRGGEVAARLFEQGLCLPSGSSLSEADRQRVVDVIRG